MVEKLSLSRWFALKFFRPLFGGILLLSLSVANVTGQGIDDITGRGEGIVTLAVESPDTNLQRGAQRLFNMHGGFRVVASRSAGVVTLQLQSPSSNQVAWRVVQEGQAAISGSANGVDWADALARACDQVVQRLTDEPGFFAGRLVFVGVTREPDIKELFTSNLLFNQSMRITNFNSTVRGPRWSPDGRQILFTTYHRSGFPDVFRYDVNQQRVFPFATFTGVNQAARYSPDGRLVAFSTSSPGSSEIYISDAQGTPSSFRRLTRTRTDETSPAWSPDGRRLVVVSGHNPQLHLLPVEGGSLTRIPTNISGSVTEPDWNPRNPNLLCFTVASGGKFAIAVYDFSTRRSTIVSRSPDDAVEPRWLPDGRHILHTARSAQYSRLVVLDTVTGKTAPVTPDSFGKVMQGDYVRAR